MQSRECWGSVLATSTVLSSQILWAKHPTTKRGHIFASPTVQGSTNKCLSARLRIASKRFGDSDVLICPRSLRISGLLDLALRSLDGDNKKYWFSSASTRPAVQSAARILVFKMIYVLLWYCCEVFRTVVSKTWHGHCTRMTRTEHVQTTGATANMAQENQRWQMVSCDPGLVDPQNQPVTSTGYEPKRHSLLKLWSRTVMRCCSKEPWQVLEKLLNKLGL